LRLWLTVPSIGPVRYFHPQVSAPCRAHIKKTHQNDGPFGFYRYLQKMNIYPLNF
jgi:hypothetical protein